MNADTLSNLIQVVQQFYPVGMPHLIESYAGRKKWIQVLENKMDLLQNNEMGPWENMMEKLQTHFSGNTVFNASYRHFPSYTAQIKLSDNVDNDTAFTRNLVIDISLLANYYTLFIEDKYSYRRYGSVAKNRLPVYFMVLSRQSDELVKYSLLTVEKEVNSFFPDYQQISHELLFNNKVEACKLYHTEFSLYHQANLYDFIMSDAYYHNNFKVIL